MKKFLLGIALCSIFFGSCQDNYIDTGLANGVVDGSMYYYMTTSSYNWDSTRLFVDRAGLTHYFDDNATQKITFFGPTNHSIRKWMLDNGYEKVSDVPVITCKDYIERYIIIGDYMKEDFDFEIAGTHTGGTMVTSLAGTQIRVFLRTTDWAGISDAGPVEMHAESQTYGQATTRIASADIQTNTGVIHALSYTHAFGNF